MTTVVIMRILREEIRSGRSRALWTMRLARTYWVEETLLHAAPIPPISILSVLTCRLV